MLLSSLYHYFFGGPLTAKDASVYVTNKYNRIIIACDSGTVLVDQKETFANVSVSTSPYSNISIKSPRIEITNDYTG